jgi:hypothetical protein
MFVFRKKLKTFLRTVSGTARPRAKPFIMSYQAMTEELKGKLASTFTKAICGYHMVNDAPVKEAVWEDLNVLVLQRSGCVVDEQSRGSHQPGADITCSLGRFSNKSTMVNRDKASFDISSYRLTTVCSAANHGTPEGLITEINRRKNFEYYSILLRDEVPAQAPEQAQEIEYRWLLVPADYAAFDPAQYEWTLQHGKTTRTRDTTTGWSTNVLDGSSMKVTFSMSSQLWIHVNMTEEMKGFVVGSCRVKMGRTMDYVSVFEKAAEI